MHVNMEMNLYTCQLASARARPLLTTTYLEPTLLKQTPPAPPRGAETGELGERVYPRVTPGPARPRCSAAPAELVRQFRGSGILRRLPASLQHGPGFEASVWTSLRVRVRLRLQPCVSKALPKSPRVPKSDAHTHAEEPEAAGGAVRGGAGRCGAERCRVPVGLALDPARVSVHVLTGQR